MIPVESFFSLLFRTSFVSFMMAVETIFVHKVCNSQLARMGIKPLYCEVCNRPVKPGEIIEVDNTPSPFAG